MMNVKTVSYVVLLVAIGYGLCHAQGTTGLPTKATSKAATSAEKGVPTSTPKEVVIKGELLSGGVLGGLLRSDKDGKTYAVDFGSTPKAGQTEVVAPGNTFFTNDLPGVRLSIKGTFTKIVEVDGKKYQEIRARQITEIEKN